MMGYHMVMVMMMQYCYEGWNCMVDDRMVVVAVVVEIECSCCCCIVVAAVHHRRCTNRHHYCCCPSHQIHRNNSHRHSHTNSGVTLMNKNTCCVLADGEIEVEDAGYSYCCCCG
jgi:hypothetical protein